MIHALLALTLSLDSAVQAAMRVNNTPAAQVALVHDGRVVLDKGYGMANLQRHIAATPETRFEIGSVTKQFTAAAILQLKERGKLRLTDTLGKYVPEYPQGEDITIQQLLWQVSGVPNYTLANHFVHIAGTRPGSVDAALALIANKKLDFKPGSQWAYSNTNYLLLGAVVARVSRMPWETYVRKNIFAPVGMTRSGFIDQEKRMGDVAVGYIEGKNGARVAPPLNGGWAGAAGGIVSTAADIAKWDEAFFGGKVVSMQDVRLATTSHKLANGSSTGYGFGWFIDRSKGQPRIWHGGDTLGFSSSNEYYPSLHDFVIVLASQDGPDTDLIAAGVIEAEHPELAAVIDKAAPGEDKAITALVEQWMRRAQTADIDRTQLTPAFSKSLTAQAANQAKRALAPLGAPMAFIFKGKTTAARAISYRYVVKFKAARVNMTVHVDGHGKISDMDFGLQ